MQANSFDSREEEWFSWYLEELLKNDVIKSWSYHPKPFSLSEKIVRVYEHHMPKKGLVMKDSFMLNPHSYQADFLIYWNTDWKGKIFINMSDKLYGKNCYFFSNGKNEYSVIDVKGAFANARNSTAVTFPINQKWTWQKYGIFVQKIVPNKLFADTFTPVRYMTTDSAKKARKIKHEVRNIKNYLAMITR